MAVPFKSNLTKLLTSSVSRNLQFLFPFKFEIKGSLEIISSFEIFFSVVKYSITLSSTSDFLY